MGDIERERDEGDKLKKLTKNEKPGIRLVK